MHPRYKFYCIKCGIWQTNPASYEFVEFTEHLVCGVRRAKSTKIHESYSDMTLNFTDIALSMYNTRPKFKEILMAQLKTTDL